jgi:hypothetical protein
VSGTDYFRWLDAHPDARWAIETFYTTKDPADSQGWEDTAALLGLILPAECAEGRCECPSLR